MFNVGDTVICIEEAYDLTLGKEYVVQPRSNPNKAYINIESDKGKISGYYPARFKKKEKEKIMTPLLIQDGKTYLTAGGYVVKINNYLHASKDTSPGVNKDGQNVNKVREGYDHGWLYRQDGTIDLSYEWNDKLRIIEELPSDFKIPPLPEGYQWAGGYPQYRLPISEETFLAKPTFGIQYYLKENKYLNDPIEHRRFIVEKINANTIAERIEKIAKSLPEAPNINNKAYQTAKAQYCQDIDVVSVVTPIQSPISKEEIKMSDVVKFSTVKNVGVASAKFAGRLAWRSLNYCLFEPVKEVAVRLMRTARYVALTGAVVGGVYAYNYPEAAKDTLYKCLPKISISVESPEIIKS